MAFLVVVVVMLSVVTAAVMAFLVVVVVMLTVVTAAVMAFLVVVVVMLSVVTAATMMLFLVMVMFLLHLGKIRSNSCLAFHGFHNLRACQLIPGGCDNGGGYIMLPEHNNGSIQFLLGNTVSTGQNDGTGSFNLVIIELTEVLHIDLHLTGIHHGNGTIQHDIVVGDLFYGGNNIGQLAYAGWFDYDTVGVIFSNHLGQRLAEITHQAAADAAGIHFGNVNTCILQETAVNTDFTKFVFNQHQLLSCIALRNHFLDQGCFAGTQEAGVYINLCHLSSHSPKKFLSDTIPYFLKKIYGFSNLSRKNRPAHWVPAGYKFKMRRFYRVLPVLG